MQPLIITPDARIAIVFFLAGTVTLPVYADPFVKELDTDVGPLDIFVDMSYKEDSTLFKITFVDPLTGWTEPHVYYDFFILDDEGKEVFRASKHLKQPIAILHSVVGVEEHEYAFQSEGSFVARVTLYGFRMVWFSPQHADFAMNVTPKFNSVAIVLPASTIAAFLFYRTKRMLHPL